MRFFQPIAPEFITTACINSFVIAITPIAMRFSKSIITICGTYCNENLVLHKHITSEFITTACIDFFIVVITPIIMILVVIATIYFVVLSLFFCSGYLNP